MKNLITYLSKKSLSLGNGSGMTRKRLGIDSGMTRFSLASLICLCMLTLGVGQMRGAGTTVTYAQSSSSAASVSSGTAPTGSTVTFSNSYSTEDQVTNGNSMALTLTGYKGYKITAIKLSMHSNSKQGSGTFSAVAGTTTLASISSNTKFNAWYDNTSYGTGYRDVNVTMTNSTYEIKKDEDVVITITCPSGKSNNSLYCQSFTITYEAAGGGCDKEVSLATSLSNCTATFTPSGPVKTCSATASDRQVSVSITPTTGYALTSGPTVSGIASATISGSGPYTIQLPQNGNGTLTLSATCTAISVTGVSLNKSSTTIVEGNTETLTATVTPSNALDKAVTWSSGTPGVATVNSSGVVTAVSAGNATITVTTHDGSFTANCTVTVTAAARDHFIDAMHSTTGYTGDGMEKVGNYSASIPSIADKAKNTTGTCQEKHYHFTGWVTAANRANPEGNLVTLDGNASNTTYYAVWTQEGSGSSAWDGSTEGDYKIYADISGTKHYATGTGTKIASTTTAADATEYTFAKVISGGDTYWTIKTGNNYITKGSSNTDFGTSTTAYNWTIEASNTDNGTWKIIASSSTARGFIYRSSTYNQFGTYTISGVNGTEYYFVEIEGSVSYGDPKTSCTADPIDPTVTFSNGEYTVGGSALDLRTLWTSNNEEGAVTFTVTNANGTGATIAGDGYSLSATTAGSCTVQASQAAVPGVYNAISRTATITVNPPTCATPTFNNGTGTYNNDVSVTISCATANSTIHYTTGASPADPTCSSGSTGTSVTISSTGTTLKAVACKDGFNVSAVASATYTLKCATPTFSVAAGTYTSTQSVELSCSTTNAVIHYTTDGSTPTESSPTYSSAITVDDDMTIKAIAFKTNYASSDAAEAAYRIKNCTWYESFDTNSGNGGNNGTWSGISSFSPPSFDNSGWTVTSGGAGDACIKSGTSGTKGSATTPAITVDNGATGKVKFRMGPWNSTGSSAQVVFTGAEVSTGVSTWTSADAMSNGEWNDYQVDFTTTGTSLTIVFTVSGGDNRFWLDEVCVKMDPAAYTVTFDANGHGTAPDPITDVAKNSTISKPTPDPSATGWTFGGWYKEPACTNAWTWATDQVTSNTTLYAKWTCSNPTSLSISSTGSKYDFCAGESMTLTVSGSNIGTGATYQWSLGGSPIDGATSASYTTSMTAAKAGEYTCTVSNGSCSQTTSGFWVRVWQLHLGDDNIDFTNTGTGTGNNTTVHLNADTHYEFKLIDNNGGWFGLNDKTVTTTIAAFALNGTGANVKVTSGLEGNYTFAINYTDRNNPTIAITYPTATQTTGYPIYFDKSVITGWNTAGTGDLYYRIGKSTHNTNNTKTGGTAWSLVTGTDRFYTTNTMAYDGFEAWQIANNTSWADDNSIYLVNGSGYEITKATDFQKYVVGSTGVTIVPTSSHNTENGCNYWYVSKTDGMLKHTATITPPTNGTIRLEYTSKSGSPSTSTVSDLPHRSYITATATPNPGYELLTFTVTPEGESSSSLVATNGETNNHVLAKNATFAATFGAKTITITWDKNGGSSVSPATSSYTYNGSTVALATATHATKVFAGWWTDPSAGTQITEIGTTNKPTADVTYYAHWSDGNTVQFHAGVGSVSPTSLTQTTYGGAVSAFPTPTIDCDGWSFAGWKEGSAQTETTTNPEASLYAGGHTGYVPATATVNMYAVWKKNFGGGTGDVTSTYDWDSNTTGWTTAGTTQNSGGVDNSKYANLGGTGYMTYNSQVKVKGLSFAFKLSSNNTKGTIKVQKATNSTFSSGLTDVRTWTISQMSASRSSWTTYSTEVSDFDGATNCYVRLAYIQEGNSTVARYFDDIVVTYTGTIPDSYKWTSTPEDYGCVSANQVKTPVISPNTEAQTGDVSVTITCATDGATIRYTTDGTNPSSSIGTVYSGAFTVSCSATVKAIAYKATMDDSEIASQAYTITVPTPTFSLAEGTYYDANQSVTLSLPTAHTGTVIKYTTNGDDPTSSSATYSSAITVTEGTTTIKAIGYNATCGTSSSVASATYIVRFGTDYTLVTDANDLMAGDQVVMISADAGTSSKYAISTTISSNKRTSTGDYNINAGLTTATIYPAVGAAATVQVFTLGGEPGAWTFHETTNNGYLNCPSAGKLTNTATVSNSNKWTIAIASNIATIHNNEVDATIKSNTSAGHVFAAYAPATDNVQLVKLYSIPNPDPVIKIDADLSAFSACRGSASEYQSFYISGKNLDGSIVLSNVAPLAGYEFCLTSGGTYTATLELTPVSKTVAKTQVFVRLAAGATAGTKNGNLNAAVSANSLSTNIAVTGSVSTADTYTDQIHNTVVTNQCGEYLAPSCPDASAPADESCVETHFKFMGWITEADKNASGVKDDAWYIAHLVTAGTAMTADGINYYAVWAKEED